MKIIQIDGFRGIIMALFIVACLFSGFVISPGVVVGYLWNHYLVGAFDFPRLNLFQGILLWGIVAICYYILAKGQLPVSFKAPDDITKNELDMIMKRTALRSKILNMNSRIISYDEFKKEFESDDKIKKSIDKNENQDNLKNNIK